MGKLDFEAVSEATQGIEAVIAEFPKAGKFLKKMKVENLDDVGAFMGAKYNGIIEFNKSDFIDREMFLDMIAAQVEYGDTPKNTKIKGIAAHEMGHLLERALIDKYKGDISDWRDSTYAEKIVREAVVNAQKDSRGVSVFKIDPDNETLFNGFLERLQKNISSYATENCSETVAEAVCDYITNGEHASRLSKEIWKLLKRELD